MNVIVFDRFSPSIVESHPAFAVAAFPNAAVEPCQDDLP